MTPLSPDQLWQRYQQHLCATPAGFSLDISRMNFSDDFFARMKPAMDRAFDAMEKLEAGAIANPDEKRMVGHYWLRKPEIAPTAEMRTEILAMREAIAKFATGVHADKIRNPKGGAFKNLLVVGIGGSALGPQLVADALGNARDPMKVYFLDNTDPDGMDRTFAMLADEMPETLCLVISKSGGTAETRNGMLEAAAAYQKHHVSFSTCAVAITSEGSALHKKAVSEKWLDIFPMWDWVGGRTSVLSAVGLLPAALQGIKIEELISGAAEMDAATRNRDANQNPAALLALMWHHAGEGRGLKDMVILPYKDRLSLMAKYLQQLIMESIGKERDLDGKVVHQGIAVYGNKGSTDQHAYVQQLRDGINNFFATFIEVLRDREGNELEVEPGITSGDFLSGFLHGTRRALYENGRESMTITLDELNARTLGMLIALFERAVGFYATLINVNAYHQPGVEAGKKAAGEVLRIQRKIEGALTSDSVTVEALAATIGEASQKETIYAILRHLAANPTREIEMVAGATPAESRFRKRN